MRLLHLRKYIQLFMLVYILGVIAISFFFKGLTNLFVVLELIPPFGVTWMLWVTYRYQQGNERIFWLLMGLGTGSYGVAQLIWSCYKWIYRESIPNPSIADFFWNMQNVMFLIALFFILMQQKNAFKGFRLIFDCVIIMVAVGALGWEFVIYPNLQSMLEHTKWLIIITNLGYTIADLGIVFCMLIVYLGNKTLFHKKVLLMLTLGLVVFLFADSYFLFLLGAGQYYVGHFVDHLWSIALLVIGLSAMYSQEYPMKFLPEASKMTVDKWPKIILPYSCFIILCVLMAERIKAWDGVVVGTLLTLIFILIRQFIVLKENSLLVTQLKHVLHNTEYMATHDDLSQLPNKRHFERKVEEGIQHALKQGRKLAILFMDLDRFKYVNDSLGHAVGDQLIQQVSSRLLQVTANQDAVVARLGGDEFTILFTKFDELKELKELARTIIKELTKPFMIDSYDIQTSTSIGISVYPQGGLDKMALMKNADTAMYKAKALGGSRYHFYTDDLNQIISRKLDMERSLRKALEQEEFLLCYQPQVNSRDRQIVGVEALIRWKTADGSMVPPSEFIPLAEETGLIVPIGEWVVRTACRQAKQWELDGLPPLKIAFNVSPKQLLQEDFVLRIAQILQETEMPANQLILEITENVALTEDTKETLLELKMMGLYIAMDDFGTGFSSLAYLQTFQIDYLKIAQTFIRKMTEKEEHITVVKAIMAMAKSLNLAVVVEGVETEEQFTILKTIDHCVIQGYYFYKPMLPDEFKKLLNLNNKTA